MPVPGKLSVIFTASFTGLFLLFFTIYEISNSVYLTKREELDPAVVGEKFFGRFGHCQQLMT
jgi:hypothetical protein